MARNGPETVDLVEISDILQTQDDSRRTLQFSYASTSRSVIVISIKSNAQGPSRGPANSNPQKRSLNEFNDIY